MCFLGGGIDDEKEGDVTGIKWIPLFLATFEFFIMFDT